MRISAPIYLAVANLSSSISAAITLLAPMYLHKAIDIDPIGPAPITKTSSFLTSSPSTA